MTIDKFRDVFISSKDPTPIVLYGLGKQTEEILTQCDDKRIIGVLDGFREEGDFFGKSVFSLNKLQGKKVKIVIIARKASEKIIYKRIRSFCMENDISVFNIEGEDLSIQKSIKENSYFNRNKQELIDLVNEYDAISFDIFDTLLTRKISDREILYRMVGNRCNAPKDFAKTRLSVEYNLSKNSCPTLSDIYEEIQKELNLSKEESRHLMGMEMELEMWNLIPRKEMSQILRKLKDLGKKVYLVSDMYFSKNFITKLLYQCGITGYKEAFVSCEYGVDKSNGLFNIYREYVGATKYLHIGDSAEADGDSAKKCGIDYYLIKSPADMSEITEFNTIDDEGETSAVLCSVIFSQLFNSPFVLNSVNGRVHIDDFYGIGYSMLGPVMVGFIQWMIENISDKKIDAICFVSRDGYLPKKIYEILTSEMKNMPKAIYLETSRQLNVVSSIETLDDINWALSFPFAGSASERLTNQFGLAREDILPREMYEDDNSYLLRHSEIILKHSEYVRKKYKSYLEGYNLSKDSAAIFDFVSTGTCQLGIEKMLGFKVQGLYFDRIESNDYRKQGLNIMAYTDDIMPGIEIEQYFLLENWIKETTPSVKDISDDGQIVRGEIKMPEEQLKAIKMLQDGAVGFCKDLMYISECEISTEIKKQALKGLIHFNENELCLDEIKWSIFDVFTGRQI